MSDVNLTDTERERFRLHVPDSEVGDCLCGWVMGDGPWAGEWSQHMADVLAERDARVRAAALAPIQALADEWMTKAGPESQAWRVYGPQTMSVPFVHEQITAALAAAGVDAAPDETTTELRDALDDLRLRRDSGSGVFGPAIDNVLAAYERTAIPSGHEQED